MTEISSPTEARRDKTRQGHVERASSRLGGTAQGSALGGARSRRGISKRVAEPETNSRAAAVAERSRDHAPALMRQVLDDHFAGGAHLEYTGDVFWHFRRTHWVKLSEKELGGVILKHLLADPVRSGQRLRSMVREVVDLIKWNRATEPDRSRLAEPLPVINAANGELWIRQDGSVELRPHNPASKQRHYLDIDYDPKATCPQYDDAVADIFSVSTNPAALVAFWHEFTGYVLQPTRPDARIFVCRGWGNDGKSALISVLVTLLGAERVAAMPIGKLASNQFMLSHLYEKLALIDDDVAFGTVLADGPLKTISERKVITAEPKNGRPFEFGVGVVPILLCNAVPHLRDTSNGFRRRLAVVPFDRCFTDAEADRTLFRRIRKEEMSGVLNRALESLGRVVRRGWKFDLPEAVEAATQAWWTEATAGASGPALAPVRRGSARPTVRGSHRPAARPFPGPTASKHGSALGAGSLVDVSVKIDLPPREDLAVQVQAGPVAIEVRARRDGVPHGPQSSARSQDKG